MLRSVDGELLTDVLGQPMYAITNSKLGGLTSENVTGFPETSVITNQRCET
jgi:hypothetical protein